MIIMRKTITITITIIIQVQILLRYGQHPNIISLRDMFQDQGKVPVTFEINKYLDKFKSS